LSRPAPAAGAPESRAVVPALALVLALALALVCAALALGWAKLPLGFNFIDEGMYLVDGWRMVAGDRLFPENRSVVLRLYALLNAAIFALDPDITLLEFRRLQFFAAVFGTGLVGLAVGRALAPRVGAAPAAACMALALALFLFTGLDPVGMVANLSYYTWPALFLMLYVACLLPALGWSPGVARSLLLLASGAALFGQGFAFFPLVPLLAVPLIQPLAARFLDLPGLDLTRADRALLVGPGVVGWALFALYHGAAFPAALVDFHGYFSEAGTTGRGLTINRPALAYLVGAAVFVLPGVYLLGRFARRPHLLGFAAPALGALLYAVLESRLLGLAPPYWRGWFDGPMWLAALVILALGALIVSLVRGRRRAGREDPIVRAAAAVALIAVPYAVLFSNYSGMGILTVLFGAAPVLAVTAALWVCRLVEAGARPAAALLALAAVSWPFYAHAAVADWRFTYFDAAPAALDTVIDSGFARGIRTNGLYADIVGWMIQQADRYSAPGDLAIVLEQSPMAYMLIRRRPALNHSWSGMAGSRSLRRDAVKEMQAQNRRPRIAFRFVHAPVLLPLSLARGEVVLAGVYAYARDDPISAYLAEHMRRAGGLVVGDRLWVELYLDDEAGSGSAGDG
jgi:hypothetical protein